MEGVEQSRIAGPMKKFLVFVLPHGKIVIPKGIALIATVRLLGESSVSEIPSSFSEISDPQLQGSTLDSAEGI
jgi:hypothetical protein